MKKLLLLLFALTGFSLISCEQTDKQSNKTKNADTIVVKKDTAIMKTDTAGFKNK